MKRETLPPGQDDRPEISSPAFIIGNGLSRKDFDLNLLKGKWPTFGCNALYRDFESDYLALIDDGIIKEVKDSTFPQDKVFYPVGGDAYEPAEFNPNRPRKNAGMFAMEVAISLGYRNLICLGFDFVIQSQSFVMGNMYDGTHNYSSTTRCSPQDALRRCEYMDWFAKANPEVQFSFAFPKELIADEQFTSFKSRNIKGISFDEIINRVV